MKVYGNVTLSEGSDIKNLTVPNGPVFPENPNAGELFYLDGVGLSCHDGANWVRLQKANEEVFNDAFSLEMDGDNVTKIIPSAAFELRSTRLYIGGLRMAVNDDYVEHGTFITLNFLLSQDEMNSGRNIVLDFKKS